MHPYLRTQADSETIKKDIEYEFEICKEGSAYGGCFDHFLQNKFKFDY